MCQIVKMSYSNGSIAIDIEAGNMFVIVNKEDDVELKIEMVFQEKDVSKTMHSMHLYNEPFEKIANGKKKIELRLNDDKRKQIKVNDIILFENTDNKNIIIAKCIRLHIYDSFLNLFKHLDCESDKYGFSGETEPEKMAEHMRRYYSNENEARYGVIGIEFETIGVYNKIK